MKIFNWNAEKNEILIVERGISFAEIVFYIENDGLLDDIAHPKNQAFSNQRIFVVAVEAYVYLVPYIEREDELFLKTIIPSRKFTSLTCGTGRCYELQLSRRHSSAEYRAESCQGVKGAPPGECGTYCIVESTNLTPLIS